MDCLDVGNEQNYVDILHFQFPLHMLVDFLGGFGISEKCYLALVKKSAFQHVIFIDNENLSNSW